MFNNRSHTQITENELEATQKALAKLEQAYAENRMTKAMYMSRRERLVKNLERTVYAKTPLALNQDGFYGRDELNLSPRPTGYKESLMLSQELDGPARKVSQSKIRQAQLQNAYSDVSSESIMDRLQQNSAPSNFNAALNVVSDMRESKLLGTKRMSLDGVWADISNTPAVVNALAKLSDSVRTRVEGAINEGIPVSAAKNYILSNARNAGAALTSEGYDRQRAAEIVTSVVNGEMNLIAAQNMVSADLREATRAITSNNLVNNEVIPNLAPVNTNAMPLNELVEVRNAAIDTLADPMADQDELDWAANFVQQANNTLNQRASENNVITGNSANQILVSTEPAVNQAENRRQKELEMQRIAQQKRIEAELAEKQRLEAAKAAREAARLEKERLAKIAAEAAMREAEEKARKAAANKAKKEANALAKKKANEARRAKEAALKAKLEAEARQAKLREEKKKQEEAAAAAAAKKAAQEKAEANRLAKLKAKEEEQAKLAEQTKPAMVEFAESITMLPSKPGPMPPVPIKPGPKPKPMPKPTPKPKPPVIPKPMPKPTPKPKPPVIPKPMPKPKPKPTPKPPVIRPSPPRPPNGPPPANGNNRPLPIPIDPGLLQPVAPPMPKPKPPSRPPMIKPGPPKAKPVPPSVNPGPPQKAPTVRPVVKPVNRRSPAQKVANAIARLPSQQNVERSRGRPTKKAPVRTPTRQSIERDIKAGRRPVLGSTSSTTSTSHDPRRFHREESAGLGASTSTTTSSRTSGAYRFEDPRLGYRWG
ncbi:MAG: hypothetical protein CMG17_07580 [Candidatus Marinimicrobia bacterium]|jgi:hypothetical protein|nr:hypothetical protein [Candidatus Neomarinimicrobiota bacterium]MAR96261.1 hypothetical protein [Candidatus Neomarinimicrobiota bacterium]MAR97487.1 hypothetical protein [Candidatus Neomarinimicrobiota bacterium]